ncbi:MAG: hypothetical protein QM752_00370 [Gammaproteobacteria bacterium]
MSIDHKENPTSLEFIINIKPHDDGQLSRFDGLTFFEKEIQQERKKISSKSRAFLITGGTQESRQKKSDQLITREKSLCFIQLKKER